MPLTTLHCSNGVPKGLDMSVKSFPISSAWMPLMKRSYSTSMAATAASSSSFPSTTNPSSKKASRCAGVRCAARAAMAHASHDQARRSIFASGWLQCMAVWYAPSAARATDGYAARGHQYGPKGPF